MFNLPYLKGDVLVYIDTDVGVGIISNPAYQTITDGAICFGSEVCRISAGDDWAQTETDGAAVTFVATENLIFDNLDGASMESNLWTNFLYSSGENAATSYIWAPLFSVGGTDDFMNTYLQAFVPLQNFAVDGEGTCVNASDTTVLDRFCSAYWTETVGHFEDNMTGWVDIGISAAAEVTETDYKA